MSKLNITLATIIIATAVILSIASVWGDSLIVDEIPHVGSGYSYLATGDYRLNPEHPPLAKDLATLPLLFLDLNQDVFQTKQWTTDINGQWEFGRKLIYNSGNDADQITHLVKLPMLLFFILSAILVFKWGHELFGRLGAFLALIIFSFSTTVMAHSRFVTTDVPALFGILYATYFFIKYLKLKTDRSFIIAALFFGIALLTKFSTILLVPFLGLVAVIYGLSYGKGLKDKLEQSFGCGHKSILVFAAGFILVVWPVYYLHTFNYPPERQHRDTQELLSSFGKRYLADPVVWVSDKPVLRAAGHYGLGLLMVTQRSAGGNTTYFLGEVSRFGWHKYFPIVYFIKEPLAWWGLTVMALLFLGWQLNKPSKKMFTGWGEIIRNHFSEFSMMLWLVIYWGFSIKSTLNIGVRHLLPTYPFIILLVSGQLSRIAYGLQVTGYGFKKLLFIFYFLLFTLVGWYIFENLKVFPYYITYFNQVVGGPINGYKYVVDSNLDWGQDLVRFSNWVKEKGIPKIEIDYFGWADPYYYMGSHYERLWASKYRDANDFVARNQTNGWLAVSAGFLQGSQGPPDQYHPINYLWLQSYEPVEIIGHSIFIYRIE